MDEKDISLEHLCKIYLDLSDSEKEQVIQLGEGLLNSQDIMKKNNHCGKLVDKTVSDYS